MYQRWLKFSFIYFGAFVISMSQLKIAPTLVLDALSNSLGVDKGDIQLLSSIFSISGIFLAIPGGMLMAKIGAKRLIVLLMAVLALGNLLGYVFISNYPLLLLSRAVEGISFAMYLMVAMVYIRHWFADKGSGTALGFFGTFSALAQLIIFNISTTLIPLTGFRSIWIYLTVLSLLTMVLFIFVLEPIGTEKNTKHKPENFLTQALSDKKIWILTLSHGAMTFILFTMIQIGPFMMKDLYLLPDHLANAYASTFGLSGIISGVLAGIIIEKSKKPVIIGALGFILMLISVLIAVPLYSWITDAHLSTSIYIGWWFTISFGISFSYTAVMILASALSKKPEVTGYHISLVNTMYYFMIVVGSPLTIKVILSTSWSRGFTLLAGVAIIGLMGMIIYNVMQSKKGQ
ncbi:MFS transporter [Entomospira culicis]|nr:MFS transporter [Entomospira culicis]WDI37574.1 MFS transporter [Entomospira culicis]WDI39202.1 MFS transporter [Entomospira culicis]